MLTFGPTLSFPAWSWGELPPVRWAASPHLPLPYPSPCLRLLSFWLLTRNSTSLKTHSSPKTLSHPWGVFTCFPPISSFHIHLKSSSPKSSENICIHSNCPLLHFAKRIFSQPTSIPGRLRAGQWELLKCLDAEELSHLPQDVFFGHWLNNSFYFSVEPSCMKILAYMTLQHQIYTKSV